VLYEALLPGVAVGAEAGCWEPLTELVRDMVRMIGAVLVAVVVGDDILVIFLSG